MIFIYHIEDANKYFHFKGKHHRTPCNITITNVASAKELNSELKKSDIKRINVEQKNKQTKLSKKVSFGIGSGGITINASVKN